MTLSAGEPTVAHIKEKRESACARTETEFESCFKRVDFKVPVSVHSASFQSVQIIAKRSSVISALSCFEPFPASKEEGRLLHRQSVSFCPLTIL